MVDRRRTYWRIHRAGRRCDSGLCARLCARANLKAIDAETGSPLWETATNPGAVGDPKSFYWEPVVATDKAGRAVTLVVGDARDDDRDGNWEHPLQIRDVRSGKITALPARSWVYGAWDCDQGFCLNAWSAADGWHEAAIDPTTGKFSPVRQAETEPNAWNMTDNLTLGVKGDYLRWAHGKTKWQRPLSNYLPDHVSPTDFRGGFNFYSTVDDPLDPTVMALSFSTTSPTHTGVFAFGLKDGSPLWARSGSELCGPGIAALCRGGQRAGPGKHKATVQRTKYVGIDVATGTHRWSKRVTSAAQPSPAITLNGVIAIPRQSGVRYLDDETGYPVDLPEDPTLACFDSASWWGYRNGRSADGRTKFSGGSTAYACHTDGKRTDAPLTKEAVLDAASGRTWINDTELISTWSMGTPIEDPLDSTESWHYVSFAHRISAYRF